MTKITVSQLTIYPVKSLRGINVSSLNLTELGPENDRQWMVINPKGTFLTQRVLARMCLIETSLEGQQLHLKHSNPSKHKQLGSISVPRGGGKQTHSEVWRTPVVAEDCGDLAAEWLSSALEIDCRLIYLPIGKQRVAPDEHIKTKLGFADAYPLLLASESSLEDFNSHAEIAITMDRFRPNIVVNGVDPYAEDNWKNIKAGEMHFKICSPCTRCVMPSIDPNTAEKQPTILDTLNTHRRFGTETRFGQNTVYTATGTINIGDEVTVIN